MKQSLLTALILFCFPIYLLASDFTIYRLPGGNSLETIIVDETVNGDPVQGLWMVEKQAGMYWLPWNSGSSVWSTPEEHDAYYPWFMGGDKRTMGNSPNQVLYSIAATYLGTHLYQYTGSDPEWDEPTSSFVENSYYRWHDAAFYEANASPTNSQNHFVVSAVQEWSPSSYTYNKGLYLVTDGQSPLYTTSPITNSSGKNFRFIYRDLENDDILYAWWNEEGTTTSDFLKVDVDYSSPNYSASTASDFDETSYILQKVFCFYQYLDGSNRHQYLVAETRHNVDVVTIDVWHREEDGGGYLNDDEWSIEWSDIGDDYPDIFGIVGEDCVSDIHKIYLGVNTEGLIYHYNTTTEALNYTSDYSEYLSNWSIHSLNLNPWYDVEDCEEIIVGTAKASVQFADIDISDLSDPVVEDYYNEDGWSSGGSDKGGGGGEEADRYGSSDYVYWADEEVAMALEEINIEHPHPTNGGDIYVHDYSEDKSIGNFDPDGAISIQLGSPENADYIRDNYPDFDPWVVGLGWAEFPQGHFYWDVTDQTLSKAYNSNNDPHRVVLYCISHPEWSHGHFEYIDGRGKSDQYNRPVDERLQTYFIRNLVNRYRPGGKFTSQNCGSWGVTEYCYENEPGAYQTGYIFGYNDESGWHETGFQPLVGIAMRMFYNYQIIKVIEELEGTEFFVISPNWSLNLPHMVSDNPCMDIGPDQLNVDGSPGAYTDPTYFDYLSFVPGGGNIERTMDPNYPGQQAIEDLYSTCFFPLPGDGTGPANYGAMQRYIDIIDLQMGCIGPEYSDSDPLFDSDGGSDFQFCYMGLNRYYEYYEIKQALNYYQGEHPNKHVVSLECTYGPTNTIGTTLTGMYFIKYPNNPDYNDLFRPFFSDFDTSGDCDYRNILFRRGTNLPINADGFETGPNCLDPEADHIMAGLLKDKYALPISFVEDTYNTGVNLELVNPDRPNSFYKGEDDENGPTVVIFSYRQSYNSSNIIKQIRTCTGIRDEELSVFMYCDPLVMFPENSPFFYIYDDEGFFSQRILRADEGDQGGGGGYNNKDYYADFNANEISEKTILAYTGINLTPQPKEQGVLLSSLGNGWNLVSFNIWPTDPNPPGFPTFKCADVFTTQDWPMLGQIEDYQEGHYFDVNGIPDPDYTWNME